MKKGSRRKANKRRNRGHFIAPKGVRPKKLRKNPLWGATDQKALRKMVNQTIGMSLMAALDIDFLGIMEQIDEEKGGRPITETVQ
jgi:hypothetical protein